MDIKFANSASSRLAVAASSTDTTLRLVATTGALFPTISSGGEYFMVTLTSTEGSREIVKVTSKSGDTFTVTRGQEGTTAKTFAQGTVVENRLTAGSIGRILNDVTATETVPGRVRLASVAQVLEGTNNTTAVTPKGASLMQALPGTIISYYGELYMGVHPVNSRTGEHDPTWHLCDGTNGTPDLQARIILGSSIVHQMGTYGGTTDLSTTITTDVSDEVSTGISQKFSVLDTGTKIVSPHNHKITLSSGEFWPPYCSLVPLMKVA